MSDLNIGGDWDFNVSRTPLSARTVQRIISAYTLLGAVVAVVAALTLPLILAVPATITLFGVLARLQYWWGYAGVWAEEERIASVEPNGAYHVGARPLNPEISDVWNDGVDEWIYVAPFVWRKVK